jgi:hypothetical protein
MFGDGSVYTNIHWFWLAGGIAPLLIWFIVWKWPRSFVRYLHVPIIFGGTGYLPP